MSQIKKIKIDPITRLEGHGKVTIHLDPEGEVKDVRFHVTQFRGYEKFCEGRPFEEMPIITQRICGICPVSHQLASAKACDAILGVEVPETARLLRELEHMGQYIQSHALHFFYLASPDLLLGWDADPAKRNVVGVIGEFPDAALKGIRLRKFGQEIIKALGGKRVHPVFAVPGGVSNSLSEADRDRLLQGFDEAYASCRLALDIFKGWLDKHMDEAIGFGRFSSLYTGLVDKKGDLQLYDGIIRIKDKEGEVLSEFDPSKYLDYIGEWVEPWSYLKFPFYKPKGYPEGCYRVGPLGRLNVADRISTPKANEELKNLRKIASNGILEGSLLYHYARLVELLYAIERAEELLKNEEICSNDIRYTDAPKNEEGVGVIEAPRGTLIHHYWVDKHGVIKKANLIVATGHNNIAMNLAIREVAREYIHKGDVREGILNRIEGAIRCYDPCLSCSTHAIGQMPLKVKIVDSRGEILKELKKE
jgi:NAD-reducing hydrogenase large subunit